MKKNIIIISIGFITAAIVSVDSYAILVKPKIAIHIHAHAIPDTTNTTAVDNNLVSSSNTGNIDNDTLDIKQKSKNR